MRAMLPARYFTKWTALRQVLNMYLYFSGSPLSFFSEPGLMAMVPSMGTLYLAMMSMPAIKASERKGPTTMATGFCSRIIFSRPSNASGTGTPGAASRKSVATIFNFILVPPTFTPPLALISLAAIWTTLWASFPSKKPNEVGTPITIESAAYAAGPVINHATATNSTRLKNNKLRFMISSLISVGFPLSLIRSTRLEIV